MEINKKQTRQKNRPRIYVFVNLGRLQDLHSVFIMQKSFEKQGTPWKLSQEGCFQVPAEVLEYVKYERVLKSCPSPVLLSDLAW